MRNKMVILVSIMLASLSAYQPGISLLRTPAVAVIEPGLAARLNTLQPSDMVTAIVTLRQQTDLSRVNGADRARRLQGVILALQATANATQGPLVSLLNAQRDQGQVKRFDAFWIFNGFSVTATSSVINELAHNPDVLTIAPDDIQVIPVAGTPEPNIALVNAPALWSQGYSGQGVVVANMDTGVDISHPDLASRWRGGGDSWFDPYGQHPTTPIDFNGHGTWTMGVMVGGGAGGTSVGMAPGAQWIAVKIFNDSGGSTATAIHQGFQWMLDPDGNPNTADAPQVVNNSWTYASPGCYLDFEPDLQALQAAGILPVFAAGNGGPNSNTSYSPSNNPSAFAVGATNNNDQIYTYSSRGPTTCGGSSGPFPELVAPGVNIRTTDLYGSYYYSSGTSLAAPHVSGALALLLSAFPNLDAADQRIALSNSAVDLGEVGPDDTFGAGRIDELAAYNLVASGTLPTATATPTSTPASTATSTATFTPSPTPTSSPTPTPTSTSTPVSTNSVHVGDLDSTPDAHGGRWNAVVVVTVHDAFEAPFQGVTVNGNWSSGATGSGSCTTDSNGSCSISRKNLKSNVSNITFTVTGLDANLPYDSSSNHDPDGDSTGTFIIVYKP